MKIDFGQKTKKKREGVSPGRFVEVGSRFTAWRGCLVAQVANQRKTAKLGLVGLPSAACTKKGRDVVVLTGTWGPAALCTVAAWTLDIWRGRR